MRRLIKIKDKYFEWSTIVDAPVTYAMTYDELKSHISSEYGNSGSEKLKRFDEILNRDGSDYAFEDIIEGNRAGNNESELTASQIYDVYSTKESFFNYMEGEKVVVIECICCRCFFPASSIKYSNTKIPEFDNKGDLIDFAYESGARFDCPYCGERVYLSDCEYY